MHAVQKVKAQDDPDLVFLETDDVLFKEPGFRYDRDHPTRETCLAEVPCRTRAGCAMSAPL